MPLPVGALASLESSEHVSGRKMLVPKQPTTLTKEEYDKQVSEAVAKNVVQREAEEATRGKPACFIPARKGSKRLKNKNKLEFEGMPLFLRAVKIAQEANIFGHIIVSSDDEEILEMAYENHVLPHRRPKALATDGTQLKYVCKWLCRCYRGISSFALLIPNNPFRTVDDVKGAYKFFVEKNANYVMSAVRSTPPPQLAMRMSAGKLYPFYKGEKLRSQKMEKLYRHDGAVIFARAEAFLNEVKLGFYGSNLYPYFIEHPSIDIDTQEDLELAMYYWGKRNEVSKNST